MNISTVKNFEEFHRLVESEIQKRGVAHDRAMLRGMANAEWALRPKIGRILRKLSPSARASWEQRMFRAFKRRALPHVGEWHPKTEWEWLALAQHHGMPTRLLDWTYNPLVALYFAVEPVSDTDSVICVWRAGRSLDTDECDPFDVSEVRKFTPPALSPRITTQEATFTIHPDPFGDFAPDDLIYIIVPCESRPDIRRTLFNYGFTPGMLFPGLDGVANDVEFAIVHEYLFRPDDMAEDS